MSNNQRDISVSTTRNSHGQLISSQSIDGVKYYTYRFHLFILPHSTRTFINQLRINGLYLLKDWIYFVEMNVLQAPSAGNINNCIVNGVDSNLRWENGNGTGKDLFEIVTTSRIDLFEIKVTYPLWHAGWCIYEDDVLVFKDVVNAGSGNSPSNAYYYYPLNNGNLPHKLLPIENSVGQGWRLIRQLPPNSIRWFPGDINFSDVNEDEELLFTTGNCSYWCITTRSDVCGTYTNNNHNQIKVVTAINSNFGQTNIQIHYRTGNNNSNEPSIFLRNNSNSNTWRMYRENLNNQYNVNNIHASGMYVYARSTKIVSDPNIFRYKFNLSIRSSHSQNDMVIYTTNTIKIDGVLLEEYLHLKSYITNYVNDIVSGYIHWRTNYNVYFGKNVIEIVTTSRVTNFQIRYVHKSMAPGLKIYENDNLVYQDVTNGGSTTGSIWINYPLNHPPTIPIPPTRYYGLYKQITTSYDGVTGQVSSSSESYINALTSSYSIDGNGSTVENLSNHKNELINIITTTVPDADNIITIINEDKLTNIITTTIKENDAIKAVEDTIIQVIVENPQNYLGVQITIEDNFESGKKTTITTNHIDTSEFVTRTVVTFIADDTFDSWAEVSETKTIDATTTEVTTTHKNEDGSARQTVTLTTTDTELIRVKLNFTDKSDFETQTYTTLLNGDFVSWIEVSEIQTIDATTTDVTTTHKNEGGDIKQTVTLTTTDTQYIRVTENLIDKSEFETQTYTTLLDDTFVSWIEKIESYTNPEGNLEFARNIKDASGTTNVNVQIVTTIIDGVNNTKTVQTVNTIDKSEFETKNIVTDSSGNDAFISWLEESETIVNGNVEEVTTVEKDENGNFLRIETTSTNSSINSVSLLERDVSSGTTFVNSDRKILPPEDIPGYNSWIEPAVFNNNYFFINHSTGSYMDGQYKVKASSILPASGSNPNRIPTFSFDHITDPPTYNLYVSEYNTFSSGVSNNPDGVIIEVVLPDILSISYYTLQTRNAYLTQMCKKWVFEASTNNVDWILLDSRENETGWSSLEKREYYVLSSSSYENKRPPYRYYRWRILETNGDTLVAIFGIKLYGFIYSSKLTTTITNGDGSEKITESFTNLLSVIKEINSSGTETLVKTINPPNSSHEIHVVEEDKLTNIRTTTKKDAANTELDAFTMVDTTIPSLGVIEIITDYLTLNSNNEFITTIDDTMNGGNFITITKDSTKQDLFRETKYPKDNSNNTVTVVRIEVFPVVVYPDIYETTTVYQSSVNPANIQTITEESPPSSVPISGFIETFSRESDSTEILFERLVKENATDKIETITNIASHLIQTNFKKRKLVYTISGGVESIVSVTDTSDDDLLVSGITTVIVSEKDITSTDYAITKFTTTISTEDSTNIITEVIVENIDLTLINTNYVKQTTVNDSSGNPETITTQYAPSGNEIEVVIDDVDALYPDIKYITTTYAEADFPNTILSIAETSSQTISGITYEISIKIDPVDNAIITKTTTTIDTSVSPNTTTVVIENEQDTTAFKLRTIESISGSVVSVTDISEETVVGNETTVIVSEKDITSTDYAIDTRTTTTITNSSLAEKTEIIENFVSDVIIAEYKKETKVFDTSSGSDELMSTTTQSAPQTVGGSTTTEVITLYDNVVYDAVYRETTIYDGIVVDGGTILTITQELAEDTSSSGVTAITINEYESGAAPANLVKTTVTTTDTTNNTLTIQERYTDANDYSGIVDITTRYNDSSYSTQSGAIQNITVTIIYTGLSETPSAIQSIYQHAITATPGSFEILEEKVSGITDKITTTDTNTPTVTVVEDYPNAGSLALSKRTRVYVDGVEQSDEQVYRPQTGLIDVASYSNYEDDYLNLKGGFAVKHLYTDYTGYHLRVSRSSDSTEVDLKFNDGGVVVSSSDATITGHTEYLSWLGGDVANIITWYDQSGKGNHGTTQGTITFDYVNNKVVLGSDGYFSLPDGTVPYNNDNYTLIIDHGNKNNDYGAFIHSGDLSHSRGRDLRVVFRINFQRYSNPLNYYYIHDWNYNLMRSDDYTFSSNQVVAARYDNDNDNVNGGVRSIYIPGTNHLVTNTPGAKRISGSQYNEIGASWNERPGRTGQWRSGLYSVLIYEKALDYSDIDIIANRLRPS